MDFERGLETQRLRLLRLLAGLAMVVAFMSRVSAVCSMPQSVCAFVAGMLTRIGDAIDSLVIVTALVFCGYRGDGAVMRASLKRGNARHKAQSAERLLRRIARMQAVLANLPRHARLLIKRLTGSRASVPAKVLTPHRDTPILMAVPVSARIERPPDKPLMCWRAGCPCFDLKASRFTGVLSCALETLRGFSNDFALKFGCPYKIASYDEIGDKKCHPTQNHELMTSPIPLNTWPDSIRQ